MRLTARVLLVDFTNPEAVDWWQAKLQKVIDDGAKGFKLDRGDEILVSPVLKLGMETREIYLPEGNWVDYWNPDRKYEGQARVTVKTPVYKILISIKEDSDFEILDLNNLYKQSLKLVKEKNCLLMVLKFHYSRLPDSYYT